MIKLVTMHSGITNLYIWDKKKVKIRNTPQSWNIDVYVFSLSVQMASLTLQISGKIQWFLHMLSSKYGTSVSEDELRNIVEHKFIIFWNLFEKNIRCSDFSFSKLHVHEFIFFCDKSVDFISTHSRVQFQKVFFSLPTW